jgi:hypothetical protein
LTLLKTLAAGPVDFVENDVDLLADEAASGHFDPNGSQEQPQPGDG